MQIDVYSVILKQEICFNKLFRKTVQKICIEKKYRKKVIYVLFKFHKNDDDSRYIEEHQNKVISIKDKYSVISF